MALDENIFNLDDLLVSLEDLFRLRAAEKNLLLEFEACKIPKFLHGDEAKLRQVLTNLIGNALKFTLTGKVTVCVRWATRDEISLVESETPDPHLKYLHFSVQDTGPGISSDEIQQIFKPFSQTSSGRSAQQGTGLGLAICRQFVRLMNGEITVKSLPGQGSLFAFWVPIKVVEMAEAPDKKIRQISGMAEVQPGFRVLVVDDIVDARDWLVRWLKDLGIEVQEASNGQQAVEISDEWQPDLICMDIRMPYMDGLEATRSIKDAARGKTPVIIAITASAFEDERNAILAAGCDDLLIKPVQSDDLFNILEKHLKVQFIESPEQRTPSDIPPISIDEFHSLPAEWIHHLQSAVNSADFEQISILVDQIRPEHSQLAESLGILAKNYDLRGLMTLVIQD